MAIALMRKLAAAIASLFVVASLTFFLMKAIPGDPFQQEQSLPPGVYQALRTHYGLNDPLIVQYGRYLYQTATFNFGPSLVFTGRSVTKIIQENFPVSAALGAAALAFSLPAGIFLGLVAASRKGHRQDSLILFISVLGVSVPSFVIATLLQYILAIKLGIFPIARWGTLSQVVLPMLSLAAAPTAFIAKMTRAKILHEWQQGYALTALAKGLSPRTIVLRHLLRNAIPPVLAYLGPLAASVMTGSFIVEKIFSIPGLGYWFVTSVSNRDYPLIMGITVFYCALLLAASFLIDLLIACLNPRLRSSYITISPDP